MFSPTLIILFCGLVALVFAAYQAIQVSKISLSGGDGGGKIAQDQLAKLQEISAAIAEGAMAFLSAEYRYISGFMAAFAVLIYLLLDNSATEINEGLFTTIAFMAGGITSIISGYVGMRIAVYANVRTAKQAQKGLPEAFKVAFNSGSVMGFALVGLGLLVLLGLILIFSNYFPEAHVLYEVIAGYGLGGSTIALFGRVGGGIYTKAADVGADLVGKVEKGIPEDDPRNPAVIADNVGDNVGDIAGMGADLFGSFAEATCAALVIAAASVSLSSSWETMSYPLLISALGIITCIITSFFAGVQKEADIEPNLKRQLLISTVLMTPVLYFLTVNYVPAEFEINGRAITSMGIFWCVTSGLWSGLLIGYVTEYFTSHAYTPVREVANSCNTGAATNIIYGLALGYNSTIIPVISLAVTIYVSYSFAGMYGIALAAIGMLSTMAIGLTIDAYGPISDNAGGIAEMAGLGKEIRNRTDALDAAGNTTAAIGKGFAIGSAALTSLALFAAFVTRSGLDAVNILSPLTFAGLLFGAMLPYAFSAMTMKSVGKAALAMVVEVREQFKNIPGLMEGTAKPDYKRCVAISTSAALKEMIPPGMLVIFTPILTGFLFGVDALAGVLAGALVSGVQMAIASSNTGGAWDNAKKYIEKGNYGGKGSEAHKAAVIGDTVGDPFKDTSGPALNILIKLMAIISLVFAPFFVSQGGILLSFIQ